MRRPLQTYYFMRRRGTLSQRYRDTISKIKDCSCKNILDPIPFITLPCQGIDYVPGGLKEIFGAETGGYKALKDDATKNPKGGRFPADTADYKCTVTRQVGTIEGCDAGWTDCQAIVLADALDVFKLDFYNDWVNGTLYAFLLKYKKKRNGKEKFCEVDCKDFGASANPGSDNNCKNNFIVDSCTNATPQLKDDSLVTSSGVNSKRFIKIKSGYIKNYENETIQNLNNFNLFNFIKTLYLKFTHENNFIERKLPKLRKKPISVKNQKDNDISKKTTNKNNSVQQNLQLSSENGFVLPPVTLLKNVTEDIKPPSKETLDANAKVLEGVLSDYSINGNIDTVRYGPVVTRYDLQPAPGLRSQRVVSLADDIARSMTVEAVRVAMVSGQNVIGIELPNKIRETVLLRNILEHEEFQNSRFNLPVCLGKNIAGYPVVVDLAKMPHLLVAGTTGSGKSVGINAMILSLLYKHTPETCRLIMIDPKMLELSVYDGIPHLLTPVVTDPNKAIVALKWAVREMETRYMSMSKLGVRNIDSYNTRLIEARKKGEVLTKSIQVGFDPDTGQAIFEDQHIDLTPLPFIVVVIDEVADLMLVAGKEIESAVQRLAQMARAAGIHVVMATQRPSVDVITGTIKANFPTRISFQVTSKIDSRTILGEQGGEQLLGRGDMLYMAGGGKLTRVHGPFVEDGEVEKVTKFLSDQSIPDYDETITEEPESSYNESVYGLANKNNNQNDELYDQAVALIARERKASTSFIQRYFKIGYNRAATIIEKMEENNVISKPGRAGKREVLIEDN